MKMIHTLAVVRGSACGGSGCGQTLNHTSSQSCVECMS